MKRKIRICFQLGTFLLFACLCWGCKTNNITNIQPMVIELLPSNTIGIKLQPGTASGNSDTYQVSYSVTDANFKPGRPDVKLTVTLLIAENTKYRFVADGGSTLVDHVTLTGASGKFTLNFQLKNIYPFAGNPLPVSLRVFAYDEAKGPASQKSNTRVFTVSIVPMPAENT